MASARSGICAEVRGLNRETRLEILLLAIVVLAALIGVAYYR